MHNRRCRSLWVDFFVHLPDLPPGDYCNWTACPSVNTGLIQMAKHSHTSMGLGELARYCLYITDVTIYPLSLGFFGFICLALKLPSITMFLENFQLNRWVSRCTVVQRKHYVLSEIDFLIRWNINTGLWTCQAEKHQLARARIWWTFMKSLPFHQFQKSPYPGHPKHFPVSVLAFFWEDP